MRKVIQASGFLRPRPHRILSPVDLMKSNKLVLDYCIDTLPLVVGRPCKPLEDVEARPILSFVTNLLAVLSQTSTSKIILKIQVRRFAFNIQ